MIISNKPLSRRHHPRFPASAGNLPPETHEAWDAFSKQVFPAGEFDEKIKQLIAVAVAHTTQCPYCITGHTKLAQRKGPARKRL